MSHLKNIEIHPNIQIGDRSLSKLTHQMLSTISDFTCTVLVEEAVQKALKEYF